MEMIPINYFAVLACAVYAMALGFLWFGPLFGKKWEHLTGCDEISPEELDMRRKKARPGYFVSFLGALVMAYVLANALVFGNAYLDMSGIFAGLQGAFWYWLGFVVPITIGVVFWEGRSWTLWIINVSYWLILLLGMGVILSLWM